NTFVPRPTTLADFAAWYHLQGDDVLTGLADTNSEIAGFLDVLAEADITPVPLLATFAMSGGKVAADAFAALCDELVAGLRRAEPFDGVLLALHGAMVVEGEDDGDGEIIERVFNVIGPDVPLVVSMDLHANLTQRCIQLAGAIVGFRTCPHIDQRDTGCRAAAILVRMLRDGIRPAMEFVKIPMVVPASTHIHHLPGPFQRLMQAAAAAEGGGMLSASVFAVQPWLDIAEMGFATVAVAEDDSDLAQRVADELANLAWDEREAFMVTELVPIETAIERALAALAGPIVLSDLADGTGAGSPGDATAVIAALLAADPPEPAFVCVRDPAAAKEAIAAGAGASVDLMVGAKLDNRYNQPVRLRGTVAFAGPARFRFQGEGYTGVEQDMGECAVVRAGNVAVLILGNTVMTVDPAMYRAVGLEPTDAKIVVVKSHIQFRAGYDGIARAIILLDSPGMSSDHLTALPFTRIERPIFPFDRAMTFAPPDRAS
ncbi:MAG TPA: M81 family metallopeptidase, partial [Thermomicrobiales bacterium]|nr:M81 family metallopeptidase [Thermomicrobiales bacterium]